MRSSRIGLAVLLAAAAVVAILLPAGSPLGTARAASCSQYVVTGTWTTTQGNGYHPAFHFSQSGTSVGGSATLPGDEAARAGYSGSQGQITRGSLHGNALDVVVTWPPREDGSVAVGEYTATVAPSTAGQGSLGGGRAGSVSWTGFGPLACADQPDDPPHPPAQCGSTLRAVAAVCITGGRPTFGRDFTTPAPQPGSPVLTESPTVATDATTVTATAQVSDSTRAAIDSLVLLQNMDAQREALRMRQSQLFRDIAFCMQFAAGFVVPKNPSIHNIQAKDTNVTAEEAQTFGLFVACAKTLDPAGELFTTFRAHAAGARVAATGCRARVFAFTEPGKHVSKARRLRAARVVARMLKGACARTPGGVLVSVTARRRGSTIRGVAGKRLPVGFVRSRKPNPPDGEQARMVLHWDQSRHR